MIQRIKDTFSSFYFCLYFLRSCDLIWLGSTPASNHRNILSRNSEQMSRPNQISIRLKLYKLHGNFPLLVQCAGRKTSPRARKLILLLFPILDVASFNYLIYQATHVSGIYHTTSYPALFVILKSSTFTSITLILYKDISMILLFCCFVFSTRAALYRSMCY